MAELPTCQKTSAPLAPLTRSTEEALPRRQRAANLKDEGGIRSPPPFSVNAPVSCADEEKK